MTEAHTLFAQELFDGIAPAYNRPAELLSFGQYGRWRRRAVARLRCSPGSRVIDVATGTGLVARDLLRRRYLVAGVDVSEGMLRRAQQIEPRYPLIAGTAEMLPFRDASIDGLAFSYLLRYVPDPRATVREMVRALKPGGSMISIEFGLPRSVTLRHLWSLYARWIFPAIASIISPGWRRTGKFLGPNIIEWNERHSPEDIASMWRDAGMHDIRIERMSFGAGVITSGVKSEWTR
ncbi:MAG: class I SAM-dependent methyltransferase [Actinomycetota bacterium]